MTVAQPTVLRFWRLIGRSNRRTFAEGARLALAGEESQEPVGGTWGAIEHARGLREHSI